MSKEYLKAFERMIEHLDLEDEYSYKQLFEDEEIIKKALQRLESIDNAEFNEALDDLASLAEIAEIHWDSYDINKWKNTIKQALLKLDFLEDAIDLPTNCFSTFKNRNGDEVTIMRKERYEEYQEQEKVLNIIKEKEVDIKLLKRSINWLDYYTRVKYKTGYNTELTEEEFELLKRWSNGNI